MFLKKKKNKKINITYIQWNKLKTNIEVREPIVPSII